MEGKKILNFSGPPLLPMNFEIIELRTDGTRVGHEFKKTLEAKEDFLVQGIPVDRRKEIRFGSNGKLRSSTLREDFRFNGVLFKSAHTIARSEESDFWSGFLAEEVQIENIKLKGSTKVCRDPDGKLVQFVPAEPTPILGYLARPGECVGLKTFNYCDCGSRVVLEEDLIIKIDGKSNGGKNQIRIAKGTELNFTLRPGFTPPANELNKYSFTLDLKGVLEIGNMKFQKTVTFKPGIVPESGYLAENYTDSSARVCEKDKYWAQDINGYACHTVTP